MPPIYNGRLAPSPTGLPHLGNAWSFLLNWLIIRKSGGNLFLRIDDIDPMRSRPEFENTIFEDIQWLGLDWDGEPCHQSQRTDSYNNGIAILDNKKLIYPCFCTRKELRALASAPHGEEFFYPGTCRNMDAGKAHYLMEQGKAYAARLRCPDSPIVFQDLIMGKQFFTNTQYGGDFPLRRSDGIIAYQLATAIDDAMMNINLVIRGRDLLSSTPRQIVLMRYLGYKIPQYAHIPLLLDENAERLAKRHGSLALARLREKGVSGRMVVGLLAYLAGLNTHIYPCSPTEVLEKFNLDAIPKDDIILTTDILTKLA